VPSQPGRNAEPAEARDALAVVQSIYAIALDASAPLWDGILAVLARFAGAEHAGGSTVDKSTGRVTFHAIPGFDAAAVESAFRRFGVEADPMYRIAVRAPAHSAFIVTDEPSTRDGRRSPFYESLAAPGDMRHSLAGVVRNDAGTLVVVSFWRSGAAAFGNAERAGLELLLPHVAQSLEVRERASARAATSPAMPRGEGLVARRGVIVLDAEGQVLLVNAEASRICGPGSPLQLQRNRLTAPGAELREALEAARLASLLPGAESGIVRPPREEGGLPCELQFFPATFGPYGAPPPPGAATVVVLTDPGMFFRVAPERLAALGLTAAEARLCDSLLRLGILPRAAAAVGIAHGTARTHLKAVYAKLGVTSQVELVQALVSGAAGD